MEEIRGYARSRALLMVSVQETSLLTKVYLRQGYEEAFALWQARLHAVIVQQPGFISLEILAPAPEIGRLGWVLIQRFQSLSDLRSWRAANEHEQLQHDLQALVQTERSPAVEELEIPHTPTASVVEVFITQVPPTKREDYRAWLGEVHKREAVFTGFQGMYVQAPTDSHSTTWLTFLQFDTAENLDRWLSSSQRQEVLRQADSLVLALESHRVISSYAGWFAKAAPQGVVPPAWKQSLMVLLVLFPVVMLEMRYLMPWLYQLHPVITTFLGNALSVFLVSWPLMPIAIYGMRWWLIPQSSPQGYTNILGLGVLLLLYLAEISFFYFS